MFDLVISGKVVDPVDGVYDANLMIIKNKIEKIKDKAMTAKHSIELASSQLIFPGFIDPHVHMREPGLEYKEDFLSGSKAALHGGVTTIGDMPNLPEPITNRKLLSRKQHLSKKALIDILHLGGLGSPSEIRELAALVPAFKIYTAESNRIRPLAWNEIEAATRLIASEKKPITFHCEDQEINDKAKEKLKNTSYPEKHCDERPPESEITAVQNAASICRKYNAKANIAHISTAKSVKIVNENNDIMTCEVTPHHLFFRKEDMRRRGNLLKVNPPLRSESERRALLRALKKDRIDMLATDHAPHTLQEKFTSAPSGVPGLDTYGNFVLRLMIEKKIKPQRIAEITSYNAANYFGLTDRARIKEKFLANLVVLDMNGKTTIKNENLQTKCKWSPFAGEKFPGHVVSTIVKGKVYGMSPMR